MRGIALAIIWAAIMISASIDLTHERPSPHTQTAVMIVVTLFGFLTMIAIGIGV